MPAGSHQPEASLFTLGIANSVEDHVEARLAPLQKGMEIGTRIIDHLLAAQLVELLHVARSTGCHDRVTPRLEQLDREHANTS